MKSDMEKQNVSNDSILDYWKTFFPESKDNFEKSVTSLLGMDIDKLLFLRQVEDVTIKEEINNIYFNIKSVDGIQDLKEINDKLQKKQQWVYFFEPIIVRYFKDYQELVWKQQIIKDKKTFLEKIFTNLYVRLVNMSFRTIVMETNIASEDGILEGNSNESKGKYYCEVLLKNKDYLKEIYEIYPELIRLLDNYVENTLNYLRDIFTDIDILVKEKNCKFGMLLEVKNGLGDTHNNGKSVAKIVFEKKTLYYKPRQLTMEKRYSELLKWCEKQIPNYKSIKCGKVYEISNSGFMEAISYSECNTLDEVSDFYYKIGELLCILYTLNSKDFHCENIIADGDSPVLIDLETLLHGTLEDKKEDNIIYSVNNTIQESVIGTSLLPTLLPNTNTEEAIEVGGIGKGMKQISPFKTQVLRNTKADNIEIEFVNKELPLAQNYPKYNGTVIGCSNYLQEVRNGFSCIYLWILEHKEAYVNELKTLFGEVECRVICKNTNIYTQLLETGYHPDVLHNKWDRKIYLCRLGLLLIQNKDWDRISLYKSEYNELLNGDIPIFYMRTNDYTVYNRYNEKIFSVMSKNSVVEIIHRKVEYMGENDYQRQIALINHSFMGSNIKTDLPQGTNMRWFAISNGKNVTLQKLKCSCQIAELLARRGIKDVIDGKQEMMWIGMRGFGKAFYTITPIGLALYQGNSGIALFYYLLYSKTKNGFYRKIADETISPVVDHLNLSSDNWADMEGYGAFTGITSEVYTILYLYKHRLIDNINLEIVKKIVRKGIANTEVIIQSEKRLNLLSGLSGILGVYLTAYEILENSAEIGLLEFMQSIVKKILQSAITIGDECITWNENGDVGYAHGNAGIISQLARYYVLTHDKQVKSTITKALKYERTVHYNPYENKWHLRKNVHYFSWCNGIGGLLLEKSILLKCSWDDALLRQELVELSEQLKETGFGTDASICHGDMGTIQLLKLTSSHLNSLSLYNKCENMEMSFIERFLQEKWNNIKYMEDWGLMTGLSGIGTALIAKERELIDLLCLM